MMTDAEVLDLMKMLPDEVTNAIATSHKVLAFRAFRAGVIWASQIADCPEDVEPHNLEYPFNVFMLAEYDMAEASNAFDGQTG